MTKRALLFINQKARLGEKKQSSIARKLEDLGLILHHVSTDDVRHLPELIETHKNQVDLVIIGGGDGTLNAAVDALVAAQLPLAILPLGTANDLARTLGIPSSIADACRTIVLGQLRPIDLGWVNGKHFFNVASLGLSVRITQKLSSAAKRRLGILAYTWTALRVLWTMNPFQAEIRDGDQSITITTVQLAVGNGLYYGGGMAIAQDASIADQKLDLYSLEVSHWWQLLPLLPALRKGRKALGTATRTIRSTELEIITPTPQLINTDGEITTQTPAQFKVIPHALQVVVPQETPEQRRRAFKR